jgi:hypothetical protein
MVSPLAYSRRALLIERRMAGVIVLSSLRVATRTEAMPRISFKAFLMSAMSALSSSVIIICAGLEIDVADAISLLFNDSLLQNYEIILKLTIILLIFYILLGKKLHEYYLALKNVESKTTSFRARHF